MSTPAFATAFAAVARLVEKFDAGRAHYMSAAYQEAEARKDFIDKFWKALGWDVDHDEQHNPYQQEVQIERSQTQQGEAAKKRADYAFFLKPDFRQEVFFVEAKKPIVELHQAAHYFQTARYGWNAGCALCVLHDFEQMEIIDCRPKPDITRVMQQTYRRYTYKQYLDKEKFSEIYWLFSREAVAAGNLKKATEAMPKAGRGARQKTLFAGAYKPIDDDFLNYIDGIRADLAKAFKKGAPHLDSEALTEATQRTVDRLVFIRFLEDKQIEPEQIMARWTSWKDFVQDSRRLDAKYNGVVFKPNALIDDPTALSGRAEKDFLNLCEDLSGLNNPYHFNYIPIHILGSIYERFLGKVVADTGKVEEKPEVRKAGGVYYTPKYIVDYIVRQTVGKRIDGLSPDQIAGRKPRPNQKDIFVFNSLAIENEDILLKHQNRGTESISVPFSVADIACGSGSFLIGVYECLLDYHRRYYQKKYAGRTEPIDKRNEDYGFVELRDGVWTLTLKTKQEILLNNIYGVDLDAQAVEVTQLSLFLKMLEDESLSTMAGRQLTLTSKVLPDLSKNIQSGNSLIGWDVEEGRLFEDGELRKLNPFDYESAFPKVFRGKAKGFDVVVGNPPYGRILAAEAHQYVAKRYPSYTYTSDIYVAFFSRVGNLLRSQGTFSFIVPSAWLGGAGYKSMREELLSLSIEEIISLPFDVFKDAYVDTLTVIAEKVKPNTNHQVKCFSYPKKIKLEEIEIADADWNLVTQQSWSQSPDKKFTLSEGITSLVGRLRESIPTITGDFLEMKRGVLFDLALLSEKKSSENSHPYFQGDVYRYVTNEKTPQWIEYGPLMKEYPKEFRWFDGPRLLMRRLVNRQQRLMSSYTERTFITNKNLYSLLSKVKDEEFLPAALGVLNSTLISKLYIEQVSQATKDDFPQVTIKDVIGLPFPEIKKKEQSRLSTLVSSLLEAKQKAVGAVSDRDKTFLENRVAHLDKEIDRLVYELYGLTEEEIALVEGV